MKKPLLALTVLQPWAYLLAARFKPVENRTWPPGKNELVPGDAVAIHAGTRVDREEWASAVTTMFRAGPDVPVPLFEKYAREMERLQRFPFHTERNLALEEQVFREVCDYGAIVAVGILDEIRRQPRPNDPWWAGPVGWYFRDMVQIEPVHHCGARGLWRVDEKTLPVVRQRYREAMKGSKHP